MDPKSQAGRAISLARQIFLVPVYSSRKCLPAWPAGDFWAKYGGEQSSGMHVKSGDGGDLHKTWEIGAICDSNNYILLLFLQCNLKPILPSHLLKTDVTQEQQPESRSPSLKMQLENTNESSFCYRPRVMTPQILEKIKSFVLEDPTLFSWELREKLIIESKYILSPF